MILNQKITIIIVDDHTIIRHGLKESLNKEPGFSVLADTDNGSTETEN